MTSSDNSDSANLSGLVTSTDGEPINGLCVIAANASNILQQHTVTTDDTGRFAIDLPTGRYDLLLFDEIHEPLILADTAVEEDLTKQIVRPAAGSSTSAIHGTVSLADRSPAAGLTVELHDGSASGVLASVVTASDGSFEFADCAYGYHLLLVRGKSGEEHWASAPKPETAIEVNVTLADERALETVAVTGSSAQAAGGVFSVCSLLPSEAVWRLSGGSMPPNSGTLRTNVVPLSVNVYVISFSVGYLITVDRREPETPFSPARPPAGYYRFTDETGDTYFLTAILPYVHTNFYTSTKPTITAVTFTQGMPFSGAWPSAPKCS
jgi:carboxypeptidase family protein